MITGKFSWIHFEEPDFNNGTALAMGTVLCKESSNQPSLTGLVFLAHCTQHWFGAVPSFSSSTACMHRTVLGYYQVVPAGLFATNSCDNSGAGKELHLVPN